MKTNKSFVLMIALLFILISSSLSSCFRAKTKVYTKSGKASKMELGEMEFDFKFKEKKKRKTK